MLMLVLIAILGALLNAPWYFWLVYDIVATLHAVLFICRCISEGGK